MTDNPYEYGQRLQVIGPGGTPCTVEVSVAFTPAYVAKQLESGAWRLDEPKPKPRARRASKPKTDVNE